MLKMNKKEIIAITAFLFLVISIMIFYFNSYTTTDITGAAVSEEKKEGLFYGTYSIKPSFKVSIDYDLNDYNKVIEKASLLNKKIIECEEKGNDIETCLKLEIPLLNAQDNNLKISLDCDDTLRKVFYSFLQGYKECLELKEDNCICEYSMEQKDVEGNYKIIVSSENENNREITKLQLKYEGKPTNLIGKVDIKSNVAESFLKGDELQPNVKPINQLKDKSITYSISKIIRLYKSINGLSFISEEDYKKDDTGYRDIKKCDIIKKPMYKFCVTDTKQRNLIYKFALYFKDLPPPPVENIKVYDNKNNANSVLITWKKGYPEDIKEYRLYYSKKDFYNGEIKNHKIILKDNGEISSIPIKSDVDENNKLSSIKKEPFETSSFLEQEPDNKDNKWIAYKYKIKNNAGADDWLKFKSRELYFLKEAQEFLYILDGVDNDKYNIAITAVDFNDNEIDNKEQKLKKPEIIEKTIDVNKAKYLQILWEKPLKNIDGSVNKDDDIEQYNIYYQGMSFTDAKPETPKKTLAKDKNIFEISLSDLTSTGCAIDARCYFAITSIDKNGNEFKDFGKLFTEFAIIPK